MAGNPGFYGFSQGGASQGFFGLSYPSQAQIPLSIPDYMGWYAADSLNLLDGDLVAFWPDMSPLSRHGVSQGSNRPTFKTNIVNGKPVIRFAGVHSFTLEAANKQYSTGTYFFVWKRVSATNNDILLITTATVYSYLQYSGAWYYYNAANQSVPMDASAFYLKCAKYDGSNVTLYTNGGQNASPVSNAPLQVRYLAAGTTGYLNGDIAEVVLFSRALDDTERQLVENYLNGKYALW